MADESAGYIRLAARRNGLTELAELSSREGFTGITPLILERQKFHQGIPYVQIGRNRYTRRDWVLEWLEAQKTTDSPKSQEAQSA